MVNPVSIDPRSALPDPLLLHRFSTPAEVATYILRQGLSPEQFIRQQVDQLAQLRTNLLLTTDILSVREPLHTRLLELDPRLLQLTHLLTVESQRKRG